MNTRRNVWGFILNSSVIATSLWIAEAVRRNGTDNARIDDIITLSHLCMTNTSIKTTDQLMAYVATQHIQLHSPIAKDKVKPCYSLVHPFDANADNGGGAFTPNEVLIEETNTTDSRKIYASSMDGKVFLVPHVNAKTAGSP